MCLKYFSKTLELYLGQGNYNVKVILNFYMTEVLLFLELLQKWFQVHKSNHGQMLYKNRLSLAIWLMPAKWKFIWKWSPLLIFPKLPQMWKRYFTSSRFHMKITLSVKKSLYQDCGPCYLHLLIFFFYIHFSLLQQNK